MNPTQFQGIALDRPLTIAEVAKHLGWSTKRLRRVLMRLEEAKPGTLRRSGGPRQVRYTITLRELRGVFPRFGLGDDSDTLINLQERIRILERQVKRLMASRAKDQDVSR